MKFRLSLIFIIAATLFAQNPNISGVWKADLSKSKMNGPAPSLYLVIIDQQGPKVTQIIGVKGGHGEQRQSLVYSTEGKPVTGSWRGLPMRSEAKWQDGALVVDAKVAGLHPMAIREKYTLSSDGQVLTVSSVTTANGKDMEQTLVLEKQPDSAGDALRKPEETAGARFKNVEILKDLPSSQFIDAMRSFSMSLGVDCEHCHVQNDFASDNKPAKGMARKMLIMTHGINDQTFGGKMEVRCYTCHRGQVEPQSRPAF